MGLIEDLSAAFVAFVIEADDAAEARRPAGRKGPWLVSLAMWRNCMQWVPAAGVTVAELEATARTRTDLHGMRRWGYVEVDGWAKAASGRPPREAVVRPTGRGARAQAIWEEVPAEVEARWAERFGAEPAGELRAALVALEGDAAQVDAPGGRESAARLDPGLPDTMPIVRHGWSTRQEDEPERRPGPVPIAELGLDSLLARPLTAFALEFEASGKLSLALVANLLPALGPDPVPLRDLPDAVGIAREQIDNILGYLERAGLAEIVPTAGAKRGCSASLTPTGLKARTAGARKLRALESAWSERHGPKLSRLREALAPLADADRPEHPPGTWRAEAKQLARLPRFPLVTHRGGFPDGS